MGNDTTSRRRFIAAAIALSGSAASISVLQPINAWAQARDGRRPDAGIVAMARLLYPHEALSDDVYSEVLGDALSGTAADNVLANSLDEAGAALDLRTGGDFIGASEDAQIAAMRAIEQDQAFAAIRAHVRDGLYLHPACWEVIGYGGPSFQDGGYLHRGAGDIDWLPEGE